jgi:hypothetical protein
MNRFFFDYTAKDQSLFDYCGHEFRSVQGAIEFAHAIAQNLSHSLTNKWTGWSVVVRDVKGKSFLSLPVGEETLRTA